MSNHAPLPCAATFTVVCLCAQWCGTCRDYQAVLQGLHTQFAGLHTRWVDIEDQADLVDPIEVDNFPTVLIAQGATALFFGTLLPHAETLQRMLQSYLEGNSGTTGITPQVQALWLRLQATPHPC